jgi:P4 family phage/plasmid primase-like protien
MTGASNDNGGNGDAGSGGARHGHGLGLGAFAATAQAAPVVAPEGSEDAFAELFVQRHGAEARYVDAWKWWFFWTGTHWGQDLVLRVFDLARKICRELADRENKAARRVAIASAKTVAAVVTLARSDPQIAATAGQWDTEHWLLNTPGGVADLHDGTKRPGRPEDYMLKTTAVVPRKGAAPKWIAFLDKVTARNKELQAYLQRMAGYALFGGNPEHALFFLYGTGFNGKGVFLNMLVWLLESYAHIAPMELFLETHREQHPTDLASLQGKRLVVADETSEGRHWNEGKIKMMTGGTPITAHFMRKDPFTFIPQFTPYISGNHKPSLRNVDPAIKGRMHLVPFTVFIPESERDERLGEKLKAEGPQILQWAIDGCLSYQKIGLAPPKVVRDATNDYLREQDRFTAWIEQECELGRGFWAQTSDLFHSWKMYIEINENEAAGTQRGFVQKLLTLPGVREQKSPAKQRGYSGIRLKPAAASEAA